MNSKNCPQKCFHFVSTFVPFYPEISQDIKIEGLKRRVVEKCENIKKKGLFG